jgi:hypothetical protein
VGCSRSCTKKCDLTVRPDKLWTDDDKAPRLGNATLPFLFFRPSGYLDGLGLPLRVIRCRPFAAVPWLLSGGFQRLSLLPGALTVPQRGSIAFSPP